MLTEFENGMRTGGPIFDEVHKLFSIDHMEPPPVNELSLEYEEIVGRLFVPKKFHTARISKRTQK